MTWGGAFENMERARRAAGNRGAYYVGSCFFCSSGRFRSLRYATLIMINLPFALIGGVVSLWLADNI